MTLPPHELRLSLQCRRVINQKWYHVRLARSVRCSCMIAFRINGVRAGQCLGFWVSGEMIARLEYEVDCAMLERKLMLETPLAWKGARVAMWLWCGVEACPCAIHFLMQNEEAGLGIAQHRKDHGIIDAARCHRRHCFSHE